MKFRKVSTALALAGVLMAAPGCKDFFDVNTDPIHPTTVQLSQLLSGTQVAMSTYMGFNIQGLGQPTSALVGQLSNSRGIGTYQQDPNAFSSPWSGLYSDMLQNNEQIITQGTTEQNWAYVGVAQIQKAYVFSQLVDAFGSLPYSEALKGAANRYPRFDKDEDIYNGNTDAGIQGLFSLIDEGIANLQKPGVALTNGASADLAYTGNLVAWQHFARSLKLKLYNQIRKTRDVSAEVSALLAQDMLAPSENFEIKYGTSSAPENRHIGFQSDYVNTPPENSIAPYLYLLMKYGNGQDLQHATTVSPADPRIEYYFYNQINSPAENPSFDYQDGRFVTTRVGSFGTTASTNNSDTKTLPGLYPYGGRYDNGVGLPVTEGSAPGNGIQRLLPYFCQKFTEAELQLEVLNNPAAAEAAYIEGVTAAFNEVNKVATRVNSVPPRTGSTFIAAPTLAAPPASILTKFGNASSQADKLRIIMEQKYIASFGMGMDTYTDFRRTHYPVLTIPSIAAANGPGFVDDNSDDTRAINVFPRRLYYPLADLIANTNPTSPKVQIQPADANYRIFWDKD